MPKQNRLKLSDEIERTLEEKITRKTQASVQQLVEQELNSKWENKFHAKCKALIAEQFESIKLDIAKNRKDISLLTKKTDIILGSVAYISDEYDDFRVKIAGSDKVGNKNEKVVSNLKREIEHIVSRQNYTEEQLDNLEQYGRRENLEIHSVPTMRNENTNQIVKTVAKALNVHVTDEHISTSHRLPVTSATPKLNSSQHQNRQDFTKVPAPIIVRFSNRDKRNERFHNKKKLRYNPTCYLAFGNAKPQIRENLTSYRKMLYNEARLAKRDLNFRFLWTSQGNICLWQDSDSRIININSLSDLTKLGYCRLTGKQKS